MELDKLHEQCKEVGVYDHDDPTMIHTLVMYLVKNSKLRAHNIIMYAVFDTSEEHPDDVRSLFQYGKK